MKELEPLVGDWTMRMVFRSVELEMEGTVRFEWILGGAFLLETSAAGESPVPSAHIVIARAGDAFRQHYFDSRGVVREYDMTFDGREWTLARYPDPPDFHQRFRGELAGDEIRGYGERVEDGEWIYDYDIVYTRVGRV